MKFFKNTDGNMAMIVALALIPMLALAGFALDVQRQERQIRRIQASIDASVLAAAKYSLSNRTATETEIEDVAKDYFASNFEQGEAVTLNVPDVAVTDEDIAMTVTGNMPTAMMSIIGKQTMNVGATATAAFGDPKNLELALVLDVSESMLGSKLTALETAATDMIDELVPDTDSATKVAIVPFNNYVNVGLANEFESWLDVPASYTVPGGDCSVDSGASEALGCTYESYACDRDGVPGTCWHWVCPPGVSTVQTCTDSTYSWKGCVNSRPDPLNIQDTGYVLTPVPGYLRDDTWGCPSEITPLTDNKTTLNDALAALDAESRTYIATGLTWGYRTLSPTAPFDEGEDYAALEAAGGRKALVLMSDGANTRSVDTSDGDHWNSDVDDANTTTTAVCSEIKAQNIAVYTIAFEVTDPDTRLLLENCATTPTGYYEADDAAELQEAFADIGAELREIALSK